MVSRLLGVGRLAVRDTLASFLDRSIIRGRLAGGQFQTAQMSIREISRRTGVARSTVQDFISDPTRSRASTVARMESLLDDSRLFLYQRGERVLFVDAPRFTEATLRNLNVPEDATAVRITSKQLASPGREYGSTSWLDIEDDLAQQVIDAVGSTDAVTRILFDVSR